MFNLHDFVLDTIRKMIGNTQDYKVMQYALTYYDREILIDEDMTEIQESINKQYENEEIQTAEENTENVEDVENIVESEAE